MDKVIGLVLGGRGEWFVVLQENGTYSVIWQGIVDNRKMKFQLLLFLCGLGSIDYLKFTEIMIQLKKKDLVNWK